MASPSRNRTAPGTNRTFLSARRNILGGESRQPMPVQSFYGSGPRGSSTSRVSFDRSVRNDEDQDSITNWQQGQFFPTPPPVRTHAGFVPNRHSRTSRGYDDGAGEEDRADLEPSQHGDAVCTTHGEPSSFADVQLLASEVAKLRSAIDMLLERQQSIEKCNEELRVQVQKLSQSDAVTPTRKRRTSLSVQVQILYSMP